MRHPNLTRFTNDLGDILSLLDRGRNQFLELGIMDLEILSVCLRQGLPKKS